MKDFVPEAEQLLLAHVTAPDDVAAKNALADFIIEHPYLSAGLVGLAMRIGWGIGVRDAGRHLRQLAGDANERNFVVAQYQAMVASAGLPYAGFVLPPGMGEPHPPNSDWQPSYGIDRFEFFYQEAATALGKLADEGPLRLQPKEGE